ncbi:coiled-coil domain-containing protein 82 [Rhineura floridana]|uniref:coiled-coil domain-containing protein 82 n=1 Tax=Rhineura floridana TaxID=261503 RepID=UPI002AC85508|nr:coiled-coil domain-containing protein 82 [Rhineura floridana]XP_061484752.1 coiled-coil domain-containing protein 82 [Rhineura floridana]XP_061484753.1 coiled-coil domain-containing protein 82 [Rhineura floridana]XP_061484754.1 coiled-coil domain-containing protein 82 [Rhineura floridana]XP_061484755.1 coiled-coil domain-containing protein 82 [Rhineura floridana]XP_061484756.1 coiled-coil domain-containing protein 82 [Rhineura floridana]
METNSVSRRYETRRNARAKEPVAKSRIDWQRTKRRSRLLDSEEEDDEITSSSEKELETSSEDNVDERGKGEPIHNKDEDETLVNTSSLPAVETGCDCTAAEDVDEESINLGRCKRSRTSVMYDSDESDDSDIVRKVFAKRTCIIDEEDLAAEHELHTSPAGEEANRKQKRLMKLQELSQRRSARTCSTSKRHEDNEEDVIILDDSCHPPLTPAEISDASDVDSMKDFIADDEEEELEQENSEDKSQLQKKKHAMSSTLLEKHIPSLARVDPFVHFKRVVRAFLINAIDNAFLISLYEGKRQKKYAQDMLTSLHYLDNRVIQPRLDNLLSRSRWKDRYKERVDSYPGVRIVLKSAEKRCCQACELQRYCKFTVILSGKSYNSETLQVDDFMSHDKQALKVGTVCGDRTQVYHNLKHFKYHLYEICCSVMKNDGSQDEPVKDSVERVFSQLNEDGWIHKQYTDLEDYMDSADCFQDEKMD